MICLLCSSLVKDSVGFLDLLFLRNKTAEICHQCLDKFEEIKGPTCPTCMKESSEDICRDCSYWATSSGILVQHEALYRYNQAMRDFFVAYKLQGDYRLRLVFANSLKRALTNYKGYTVVPVPVSSKRLEERGFCQVTSILEAARIPYLNLFKKDESDSQKLRNRKERLLAENPFSLEEGLDCPKKILIFDDIYTSGRTITHLMELLNGLGKFEIKSLSIAR